MGTSASRMKIFSVRPRKKRRQLTSFLPKMPMVFDISNTRSIIAYCAIGVLSLASCSIEQESERRRVTVSNEDY